MPPGRKPPAKKAKTSTTKAKQTLPATRNRSKTVRSRKPSSPPASPTPPPYSETIDPTLVDRPDTDVVDPALSRAWQINEHRQMCVIFDCVNPVRQFKRGTVYDETDPNTFPEYNPSPELDEDVTESDEEATLRPYNPKVPFRKYMIICDFPIERFMYWEAGELLPARLGKLRKRANKNATFHTWKDKQLPQPYARIAEQLNLEDLHGIEDDGHESIRRQAYARFVLEAFGKELDAYKGSAASFRSKVFTPILQRQLQGIPDAYAPTLTRKISLARPCGPVTIHDATAFYLGIDPLNPLCIGGFRRNLIYIREARWHLAVRLGNINVESKDHFEWYLDNHEVVLKALKTEAMKREADHGSNSASESESESESEPVSGSESEDRGKGKGKGKGAGEGMRKHITKQMKKRRKDTFIPPLSYVEVEVILVEELEPFFAEALRKVPELVAEAREAIGHTNSDGDAETDLITSVGPQGPQRPSRAPPLATPPGIPHPLRTAATTSQRSTTPLPPRSAGTNPAAEQSRKRRRSDGSANATPTDSVEKLKGVVRNPHRESEQDAMGDIDPGPDVEGEDGPLPTPRVPFAVPDVPATAPDIAVNAPDVPAPGPDTTVPAPGPDTTIPAPGPDTTIPAPGPDTTVPGPDGLATVAVDQVGDGLPVE